jgi:diketogulonate reductase-like aldo/keto reductase
MSNETSTDSTDRSLAVDTAAVPKQTLYTGAKIPSIGLGTFGSDKYNGEQIAAAVLDAASLGYRHFDCASVYGNEREIGRSFRAMIDAGIPREEIWVTSKVWNDMHAPADVIRSCRKSLDDLQVDYLDLYLIHWPFPNYHAPGCDVDYRHPNAKPYLHDNYMRTWQAMEKLVEMGLVRHIGTSNMTVPKLELVYRDAEVKPAVNEMELHPHFQQPELFQWVVDHDIVPIAYCPIGSPSRPDRDRVSDDTVDIEDPVIQRIAERLNVHPAVVCIKWAIQRGQIPIPFSVKREQYLASLQAAVSAPLTQEEMSAIAAIDKGCRLIKGQVFLWKDGQTWEDLWDVNGHITPP